MFRRGKKTEIREPQDPFTLEARSDLQVLLDQINEQLALAREAAHRSFDQKVSGEKTDGEHNVDMDAISMSTERLQKAQLALLARIERINSNLAGIALKSSADSN